MYSPMLTNYYQEQVNCHEFTCPIHVRVRACTICNRRDQLRGLMELLQAMKAQKLAKELKQKAASAAPAEK